MGKLSGISNEAKDQLVKKYIIDGQSSVDCAKWLKDIFGILTTGDAVSSQIRRWGFKRQVNSIPKVNLSIEDIVKADKQKLSADAEIKYWKDLYRASVKQSAQIDKILTIAKEVARAIPAVEVRTYKYEQIYTTSTQSVIAPLCDTHIGEVVDPKQMGGLNKYNIDIFNNRLYNWVEKVNELTNLRRTYTRINDLYVPLLGDLVSGDIHLELMKTNEDNIMGQMIRGAHLIAQALIKLSSNFTNVFVPCVVGNHGRMEQKPPAKNIYVSWDYLLSQWVAAFCRNQTNIHFEIPKSFFHIFTVANRKILIMHGDSIKGGFAGIPYYGFNRAAAYLRQTLQLNRNSSDEEVFSYFDAVIIGHFHKHEELDLGTGPFIVAGCVKGADEYAFAKLHVASKPSQVITFWHPKYGYISKDIVYLDRPNSDEKFVDTLSENWIDSNVAIG